ncbi:MAG: 1-(5-phosphoribosyl)-5-[(5-phosphoribosylamino)methylideneamino]imidazole-4-carboxamide isomerase [Clostridiales bacterium]|nr:1-(5-phosphoribosyl)-5-[(5-phosphoribosylamino)methylideneamino]imidazole-4-carboxamide isomerase [Clostridiales bacterium]MDD6389772.1 1-(5-phosphoribosyl)-5-[(5-phosphoribosylamino)methylideneamino]imidazole-4-carboxamide isomerase [Bacillota bacterium]MDY5975551.1 1-(5-phosphoribosyl)-5-[(5-phosphoribosylamino)methylideneamino]imidazole-4-carboxamide isomerase [Anaerovoracaceae bacterium]
MYILPAIDLFDKKAVRLFRGDYDKMTVYSDNPVDVAMKFKEAGAQYIHLVDLEGAKDGTMPNYDAVKSIVKESGLRAEIGGGIRTEEAVKAYIDAGVERVILGTAAVEHPEFLERTVNTYGDKIAVGVDLKDGYVAIKGWTEKSSLTGIDFCRKLQEMGVRTVIATDISKDGAMQGTNRLLYRKLREEFTMDIIASGGVSSIDDILALKEMNCTGAIIGKAYYTGAIDLKEAVEVAK